MSLATMGKEAPIRQIIEYLQRHGQKPLDPARYPIADDQQFVLELLEEEKVLVVQGSGFNWPQPDHFRVVFLPNSDDLTDATWSAAAAEWGEEDLIELILLVGNYRMLAGFLNAARVEPDPGLDGFPP